MLYASPSFITKFRSGNFKQKVKIELLTKEETLIEEIQQDSMDGNISVDKNRDIRRNLSITLDNYNNKFTPSSSNRIWLDKKLKAYIGIELSNGITEWIPQGVFLLRNPRVSSKVGQNPQVTLEGLDKMAGWGKLINNLTLSAGLSIPLAIQLILDGVENKFLFDDCTEVIPYELTYSSGTERKQIVKELVDMIVWDCYYDVNGTLRLKQFVSEPENGYVTWTYKKEDYTLYAGSEKEFNMDEFANVVLTIGSSSQSATVSAIARDDDLLSPFSVEKLGEILYIHNNGSPDPLITTVELAQARSDYELRHRLQLVEKQRIDLAPNWLHEEGDIFELIDDNTQTNDKYQLLSFNIPISTSGMMNCEGWKTKRLLG